MVRKNLREGKQQTFGAQGTDRRLGMSVKYWNSLPWKSVDVSDENLGSFDDSVFFGLEEIDGNAYLGNKASSGEAAAAAEAPSKPSKKSQKRARGTESGEAQETEDVTAVDEISDVVASTPKVKKQKNKKAKAEVSTGVEVVKDEKSEQSQPEQKSEKKKKSKNQKQVEKAEVPVVDVKSKKSKSKSKSSPVTVAKLSADEEASIVQKKLDTTRTWGSLKLSGLLCDALNALDFATPTPIQQQALPVVTTGKCDVIGVAETGSGKTLAYLLPMLQTLLSHWTRFANHRRLFAMVISPTRELAMQISSVLKDITNKMREAQPLLRINCATVVGGMSEEKQRRLLDTTKKPLHLLVATPGRLCELLEDDTIPALNDLSGLRFLVVDEADRIVEEGHFAELNRVFARIRDHEEIVSNGQTVEEVAIQRLKGVDYDEMQEKVQQRQREMDEEEGFNDDEEPEDLMGGFEAMPTEEELEFARQSQPAVPYDEEDGENDDDDDDDDEEVEEEEEDENNGDDEEVDEEIEQEMEQQVQAMNEQEEPEEFEDEEASHFDSEDDYETSKGAAASENEERGQKSKHGRKNKAKKVNSDLLERQTLLFSATALRGLALQEKKQGKKESKAKLRGTLKGLATGCSLPNNLKDLLAQIAVQSVIHVVDVTHNSHGDVVHNSETHVKSDSVDSKEPTMRVALPQHLEQFEIRAPAEDKDVFCYYFLYKNQGRSLVFVNSIKTARRVDGLLRALGFHSRAIHADLPQRQRLKALDTFKSSPNGILVATDVAARGLDIPKITSVVHYDIARSPQVYIHRSGRTARAFSAGSTVSLVTPEDADHHRIICEHLTGKGSNAEIIKPLKVDLTFIPFLRERVKLAKKIFTQSFVASQSSKERNWVKQNAKEMEMDLDDYTLQELGADDDQMKKEKLSKVELQRARAHLQSLLDVPVEQLLGRGGAAVAKAIGASGPVSKKNQRRSQQQQIDSMDWRKRRNGFFVYNPNA